MMRSTLPPPQWGTVALLEAWGRAGLPAVNGVNVGRLQSSLERLVASGPSRLHPEAVEASLNVLETLQLVKATPGARGTRWHLAPATVAWMRHWEAATWPACAFPATEKLTPLRWSWHQQLLVPVFQENGAKRVARLGAGWRWCQGAPGVALHEHGSILVPLPGARWGLLQGESLVAAGEAAKDLAQAVQAPPYGAPPARLAGRRFARLLLDELPNRSRED